MKIYKIQAVLLLMEGLIYKEENKIINNYKLPAWKNKNHYKKFILFITKGKKDV